MPLQLKLEIRPKARAAVSKVLLVGGATRMPAVKRFLTNMTGACSATATTQPECCFMPANLPFDAVPISSWL
jgi:molecular chaperone DnaK (HSP70)